MDTITNARQAYDYDSTVEPSEQVIKISGEKQKETVRTSPRARNINQLMMLTIIMKTTSVLMMMCVIVVGER